MNDQIKSYQAIKVQTASPAQLIAMLYDGALRFMSLGLEAMAAGNVEEQNRCLTRAQRIISELQVSLDLERGGDIAQKLNSLYDYIHRRLVEANVAALREPVEECSKLVGELREAWATVVAQEKRAAAAAGPKLAAPALGTARPGGARLDIAC